MNETSNSDPAADPISAHGLRKAYRRGKDALHGLDLSVEKGQVCALLGRNGAGKTTTIHLLLDLIPASGGEARLFGTPVKKLTPAHRQRIGYVSENQKLPDWMHLRGFLDFLRPMYPAWDTGLEAELRRIFALPEDQKLRSFSRGQKMKAAFLGALCYRPEVLILDEPFSGLDSVVRQDLLDAMVQFLADGGSTVLLSSHDLEEVERLADSIAVLNQGRLALQSSVESLLRECREVTFSGSGRPPSAPLPSPWWNVVTDTRGGTFTASACTDDAALAAEVRRLWPDAADISIRPAGLRRVYIDFLRQHPDSTPDTAVPQD